MWDNSVLLALFAADTDLAELLDQFKHNPAISNAASLAVEQLEDQAWERAWMADFQPLEIGQRLWICPSWLPPPDPDAVTVLMDPGLAFGSGSHHTTELCLQWLDQADVSGKMVIASRMTDVKGIGHRRRQARCHPGQRCRQRPPGDSGHSGQLPAQRGQP